MVLNYSNTPRWLIFLIDMGICFFSLSLAYQLRFNFNIPQDELLTFPLVYSVVLSVRAFSFYFAKTFAGIIRYTSTKDAQRIFTVVTVGSLVFCIANALKYQFVDEQFLIPFSVLIIDYLATVFLMITLRIGVKVLYFEWKNPSRDKVNIIIYGAGDSGIITKRTLDRDVGTKYKVKAFVDDNSKKAGKKIEGIKIYPSNQLDDLVVNNKIEHLVISIQNLSAAKKSAIIEKCLTHNINVLNVPPVTAWINGELSFKQIKNIKIDDLLGRDPIDLDIKNIKKQLTGKTILITGAAGSVGSGLVRQIAGYQPKKLILLDQSESPLYELDLELKDKFGKNFCEIVIGDVRHRQRIENLFRTFQPDMVYHAAAYKHVPMMELNPTEAVRTNVYGTKNIVDLAVKYKVKQFVMISTDKAVNPTNVMGASKRIAEIYAQSMNKISETRFITTRFGNVLGSNGSVIPLFKKQIEKGGPVTVTHPKVTRYFMTIPEACQLVLEAGTIGKGGEIFIFDMGKSVKIVDLAKKMIKLSGLELGKDMQIRFTGLRPGEKLYEELLADKENTTNTHHPQIMIARVREYDFEDISSQVEELIALYDNQDNQSIVRKMKEIIPEYISNNSEFSKLDTKSKTVI